MPTVPILMIARRRSDLLVTVVNSLFYNKNKYLYNLTHFQRMRPAMPTSIVKMEVIIGRVPHETIRPATRPRYEARFDVATVTPTNVIRLASTAGTAEPKPNSSTIPWSASNTTTPPTTIAAAEADGVARRQKWPTT